MSGLTLRRKCLAGIVGVILGSLTASSAFASSGASGTGLADDLTRRDLKEAVQKSGNESNAPNILVSMPDLADQEAELITKAGPLKLGIPATGKARRAANSSLYSGLSSETTLGLESTQSGLRALIRIDGRGAPERFDFRIRGTASRMTLDPSGGVNVYSETGSPIAFVAPPWASDRDGKPVPTHFEISGTTLTQVVKHRGGHYAYGIVADPFLSSAWRIAKCGAAIAAIIGGTYFIGYKLYKIVQAIRAFGGVSATARLIAGATTWSERRSAFYRVFGTLAAEILGIAAVEDYCLG